MSKPDRSLLTPRIIGYIRRADRLVIYEEIVEHTGYSEPQVRRIIRRLLEEHKIKKYAIEGYRKHYYGLPNVDYSKFIEASGKALEPEIIEPQERKEPNLNITGSAILGLLKSMERGKWVPNNQKLQEYIPYSLAKIVRAATEVYAEGSSVSTPELLSIRADIMKYRDALYSAFRTIDAIVNLEDLWIGTEFAQFLLDGVDDIDSIRELTFKVEESQR